VPTNPNPNHNSNPKSNANPNRPNRTSVFFWVSAFEVALYVALYFWIPAAIIILAVLLSAALCVFKVRAKRKNFEADAIMYQDVSLALGP